jgi:hypothetical protein
MPNAIRKQDPEKTGSFTDLMFLPFMDKRFQAVQYRYPDKIK